MTQSRQISQSHRQALCFLFVLLGVVYASWAARIPAIRDQLQISPGQLGIALLFGGIGAVAAFPVAAVLVRRRGARFTAWVSGIGLLASLSWLPLSGSFSIFLAAMFAYGASSSCFDVGINAVGADVEKIARRSIMSGLHAWFCVGTLSGSLLGGALAGKGIPANWHLCTVAAILLPALAIAYRTLPADSSRPDGKTSGFALPRGPAVALSLVCFLGAVAEGSVADWSGLFMKDHHRVGDGTAPLAFAAFTGMMLAARIIGDRLKDRLGARRVVAAGAMLACIGIAIATFAPEPRLAIAGFGIAGAGLAALFPFVYSAAARYGPTSLAAVATVGYSGNLLGPPVIGGVAQGLGMQAAIATVGLCCVLIAVISFRCSSIDAA
jgi:MFS family permease